MINNIKKNEITMILNENINLDNKIIFLKNKINNYNNDEYTELLFR